MFFYQDAHNLLYKIAVANDFEMETVNLYIGGCSLERHWNNVLSDKADYSLERNGGNCERKLTNLATLVRKKQLQTKIYFHQTWAYETDSKHKAFHTYNNNQEEMFTRTKACSEMAAKLINADISPVGEVVQKLRTLPEFDYDVCLLEKIVDVIKA